MLELFELDREPGRCYEQHEIAAYVGCDKSYISRLEKRALNKLRVHAFVIASGELEAAA
jgi:transcriptional regulator